MTPEQTRLNILRDRMKWIQAAYPDKVNKWLIRRMINIDKATEAELERLERAVTGGA